MKPVAQLGAQAKVTISQQLRLMYEEIVQQGVPERFAEILRRLDDRGDEGSKK